MATVTPSHESQLQLSKTAPRHGLASADIAPSLPCRSHAQPEGHCACRTSDERCSRSGRRPGHKLVPEVSAGRELDPVQGWGQGLEPRRRRSWRRCNSVWTEIGDGCWHPACAELGLGSVAVCPAVGVEANGRCECRLLAESSGACAGARRARAIRTGTFRMMAGASGLGSSSATSSSTWRRVLWVALLRIPSRFSCVM
jgi:hypothetical protein